MKEKAPFEKKMEYSYVIPDPEVVFQKFADSDLGKKLNNETRFHVFQPESVSNKKWVDVVGPDTNNLQHMIETFNLAKSFLSENDEFSEKEKQLIKFSAMVHDMGEVVVGDIPRPLKTEEQEEEEMRMFSGVLEHYLREELAEDDRYDLIGDVIDILTQKDSKLGKAFNAIENIGYNMTALNSWRAFRMLEQKEEESELATGLRKLAHDVMIGDISKLVNYSHKYPFVRNYLVNNEDYIIDILNDAGYEAKCDKDAFEKARNDWMQFNSSLAA